MNTDRNSLQASRGSATLTTATGPKRKSRFKSDYKVRNRDTGMRLPIAVGDDYVSEAGLEAPGIVKIDVEGLEQAVLRGLRRTLDRCRPVVLIEVTADPKLEYLYRSVDDLLCDLPDGYRCYQVESRNPVVGDYRLATFAPDFSRYKQYSVVCCPPEGLDKVPMRRDDA